MSPVWCSTSFEDIEHTGSIIQIAANHMSQVWCSTSFEDIDYTGSITQIHSAPMSPFGVLPLLMTLNTQGPSST